MPCLTPVLISKDDFLVNNNGSYNDTDVDVLPEKKSVSLGLSSIDPDNLLSSKNSAFLRAEKNRRQGSVGLDSMTNENIDLNLIALNITDKDGMNSSMTDVFGVAGTGIELIPPRQIMARIGYTF